MKCEKCGREIKMRVFGYDGEKLEVRIPCECQTQELQIRDEMIKAAARKKPRMDGIPARYKDAVFLPIEKDGAAQKCKQYATAWDKVMKSGVGLILWGPVGTGKTHLAVCIANEVNKRGGSVLFVPAVTSANFDQQKTIASAVEYDLIILDDVGAEADTEYRQSVIDGIIDARIRDKKPMIITTNLSVNAQANAANGNKDLTAQRIWDRVQAVCGAIEISGHNYRKDIRKETRAVLDHIFKD